MRAFAITMFIMMFFLGLGIMNNTQVFATQTITPDVTTHINQTYQNFNTSVETTTAGEDIYGFKTTWSFIRTSWNTLKDFFTYSLFFYPYMTKELSIPSFIATPIQMFIYIIYIITFLEFTSGRKVDIYG